MPGKNRLFGKVSAAPVFWFPLLAAWRVLIYLWWLLIIFLKLMVYLAIFSVVFGPFLVGIGIFAFGTMPVAASQDEFFGVAEVLLDFALDKYNEFIVDPWNQVQDCFYFVNVWYNMTVAFIEAIIARIADEFGLSLFTFALRGDLDELQMETLRTALFQRLQKDHYNGTATPEEARAKGHHGFGTGTKHAHLVLRAERIAKNIMKMHRQTFGSKGEMPGEKRAMGGRISVSQIVEVLCDIISFVVGFLIALIDLFGDFILTVMDIVISFLVIVIGNWDDLEFIEIIITVVLDVMLDFIDPLGCFHPFNELPQRIFPCICPHAYDDYTDVPANVFNALAGCACPGIDLGGDIIEDILKPCADVDILEALLDIIAWLINLLGQILDQIQSIANTVINFLSQVQNIKNIISGVLDTVEDIICSIPFICRRSSGVRMSRDGVEEPVEYVEVVDTRTNTVVHRYTRPARGHIERMGQEIIDQCYISVNQSNALMEEAWEQVDWINHELRVHRANAESMRQLHRLAGEINAAHTKAQRGKTLRQTMDGFIRLSAYARSGRQSMMKSMFLEMFFDHLKHKVHNRMNETERAHFSDHMENPSPSHCGPECREAFGRAIGGLAAMGRIYMDSLRQLRYDSATRSYPEVPTWKTYYDKFGDEGIDVAAVARATIQASNHMSERASRIYGDESKNKTMSHGEKLISRAMKKMTQVDMRMRSAMDPAHLPDTVEKILMERPQMAGVVKEEMDRIEETLDTLKEVDELLKEHRKTRGHDVPLTQTDILRIRGMVRKDIFKLRDQTMNHLRPHPTDPNVPASTRAGVVIIGLTLIGAAVFTFALQLGTLLAATLLPLLIGLVLALAPVFFVAIPIAADGVMSLAMTIFMGGDPQGIDYVTPYVVKLAPYVSDSYSNGWGSFDFEDFLDDAGGIANLQAQYVAAMVIRQGMCFFPKPGFLNSCPPKPRYDLVTGEVAVTFPEWLYEILECNPELTCNTKFDCSGWAPCRCGREATDEAPCPGNTGKCQCWPYAVTDSRLQEIETDTDFFPDCTALGWNYQKITAYQTDSLRERATNWLRNGYRTTKFLVQRLSRGIFVPWQGLFAFVFTLIPCLDPLAKGVVYSTLVGNTVSYLTTRIGDTAIDILEPNVDLPLGIGAFSEEALTFFRFPNWETEPGNKGNPTIREWICVVSNSPQAAASSLIVLAFLIPIFLFVISGGIWWIISFTIDILLWPINFLILVLRHMFVVAVLYRRKRMFLASVASRNPTRMQPGVNWPAPMHWGMQHLVSDDPVKIMDQIHKWRAAAQATVVAPVREERLRALDSLEHYVRAGIEGREQPQYAAMPGGVWPNLGQMAGEAWTDSTLPSLRKRVK